MKAISIKQPYANLIECGRKTLEIRSWSTNYRGPFVVCSSAQPFKGWVFPEEDLGKRICIVDLVGVVEWTRDMSSSAYVTEDEWRAGLWAWVLRNPRKIDRIPVKGRLGWFELHESTRQGCIRAI